MADIKKLENIDELNQFLNSGGDKVSILKIGADFCMPCRALETTIKQLSQSDVEGILLAEIDADDEWFEDKAAEMKVRSIPVLIAYKNGKEMDRVQGNMPKDKIIEFFDKNR